MTLPGISTSPMLAAVGSNVHVIGIAVQSGQTTHNRIGEDGETLSGAEYNFGGAFYDKHKAFTLIEEVIDGQHMVRVPAFWYRRATLSTGPNSGKEAWWAADGPIDGFELHPAFIKNGEPIPYFHLGKYQAVNDGGTKLGSFGGTGPWTGTIAQMRNRAQARGAGWMLWSIYQLAVIQMLAMIETGSTDSQAAIGVGRADWFNPANVDSGVVSEASYRNLVGLWGNIPCLVDGIFTSTTIQIWDRDGYKNSINTGVATGSGTINNLTITGMRSNAASGYNFRDIFFPSGVAGSGGTWPDVGAIADNCYPGVGDRSASGTDANGLWCIYVAYSAATGLGGRLAKEP